MLFVGVMAVLGLRYPHRRAQREGYWRACNFAAHLRRKYQALEQRRAMIEDWAGGHSVHWRSQMSNRHLASKAINNSPDPRVRRIGYDE